MYLVFASVLQASRIIHELALDNIQAKHVVSMEVEQDVKSLDQLKQVVNDFDYIIFTSPTAIEFAAGVVVKTDNCYLTVGKMTAKRLAKYINPTNILSPHVSSGIDALIKEVLVLLDLEHKKILLVKGDSDSSRLRRYLARRVDVYQEIMIYHYRYLPLDLTETFRTNKVTGIYITSSVEVRYLFAEATKFCYLDQLMTQTFVTNHLNISNLLKSYGINQIILK